MSDEPLICGFVFHRFSALPYVNAHSIGGGVLGTL